MRQQQFRISRRQALRKASAGTVVGLVAWTGACSSANNSKPGSSAPRAAASVDTRITPKAGTPVAKRGGTLRFATAQEPSGLDPSVSRGGQDHHWLYSIFDNLTNNDPTFQPAKGIADSWEVVDPLTVSFTTKTGFTYQDGTPFSTQDIKYTIERHQDPAVKSYSAGQVGSIDKVDVVDASHVVMHLKTITASLFSILGDRAGMIMSQVPTQKAGVDFTNHPIGTGPMKVDNWVSGASLKFSRFDGFRTPGYPYLDGIDTQIVPNSSVQLANLRTGNTDVIFVGQKDADSVKNDPSIQFVRWPSTAYTDVNINISLKPLNDLRVRQAMTYSLNRTAMLQGIYFGDGELATGPITKASWAYNAALKPIDEDLKRAKDLLTAAGYANGVTIDMVVVPSETSTPLSEMLKAQWARVGITANIVNRSDVDAGTEYRDQKYQLGASFEFSGRADPDQTIYENFHSKGSFNRVGFNKAYTPDAEQQELDAKIEKARQIYDQAQRKALYDDIQKQIVENVHGILFTHETNRVGLSKRVRNFTAYGDGKLRLHELWLDA